MRAVARHDPRRGARRRRRHLLPEHRRRAPRAGRARRRTRPSSRSCWSAPSFDALRGRGGRVGARLPRRALGPRAGDEAHAGAHRAAGGRPGHGALRGARRGRLRACSRTSAPASLRAQPTTSIAVERSAYAELRERPAGPAGRLPDRTASRWRATCSWRCSSRSRRCAGLTTPQAGARRAAAGCVRRAGARLQPTGSRPGAAGRGSRARGPRRSPRR